jgi:hypothetical protein
MVYFVAVLPISFQGLGTSQEMLIHFFARYAPGATDGSRRAAVLAASLVSWAVAFALQLLISLLCMRNQLARDLRKVGSEARSTPS